MMLQWHSNIGTVRRQMLTIFSHIFLSFSLSSAQLFLSLPRLSFLSVFLSSLTTSWPWPWPKLLGWSCMAETSNGCCSSSQWPTIPQYPSILLSLSLTLWTQTISLKSYLTFSSNPNPHVWTWASSPNHHGRKASSHASFLLSKPTIPHWHCHTSITESFKACTTTEVVYLSASIFCFILLFSFSFFLSNPWPKVHFSSRFMVAVVVVVGLPIWCWWAVTLWVMVLWWMSFGLEIQSRENSAKSGVLGLEIKMIFFIEMLILF